MIDLTKYTYGDIVTGSSSALTTSDYVKDAVVGKTCVAIPTNNGSVTNVLNIYNSGKSLILSVGTGNGAVKFKMPSNAEYAKCGDNSAPIVIWYQP